MEEHDEQPRMRADAIVPRGAGADLLRALAAGERSVGELVRATGLSQPNVSNHLARLKAGGLVASRRVGRRVLYRAASAAVAHFILARAPAERDRGVPVGRVAAQFLEALVALREEDAGRVVDRALAAGIRWPELYLRVFTPGLVEVGRLWERGEIPVAGEHVITGIVLRLMHRLSLSLPPPPPDAPTALVGCVEGELHMVGGRMFSDFLIASGWRVWFTGGFLAEELFHEAVERLDPDAVVLCITLAAGEPALRSTQARLLRRRGGRSLPLLAAGGAYFREPRDASGWDAAGVDIEAAVAELNRRRALLAGPAPAADPDAA